ncbi:MAG: hypothetical protein ABI811_19960 [Acidobacteriota bacterium]
MYRIGRNVLTLTAALALAISLVLAQGPGGGAGKGGGGKGGAPKGPPATPRSQAPIDMSGYWVSLVTEDWLYRMVTPIKNADGTADVSSVPVSPAGRAAANAWDPAKDEAAGQLCKAYGAAGLMRLPTRLNIDWADDNTLRVQTDTGTQTRLYHFTGDPTGAASLQGFSKATWDGIGRGGRGGGGAPPPVFTGDGNATGPAAVPIRPGAMKVITTNLSGGYLRKNGVPYSANTILTEYYDIIHEPNGDQYLVISTTVEDPANLNQPFRTSTHFKKEADGSKFKPSPCSAR